MNNKERSSSPDDSKKKLQIRCPECGRDTFLINEDDVLHYGSDGNPVLDPTKAPGLCGVCPHRAPGQIPPPLDWNDKQSVNAFLHWYKGQNKANVNHKEMNKARLCALIKQDVVGADRYLAGWIQAKATRSKVLIEKLGEDPANAKPNLFDKALQAVKDKWPNLTEEEANDEAESRLNDAICETLGVEQTSTQNIIDELIEESAFITTFREQLDSISQDLHQKQDDFDQYALTCLEVALLRSRIWTAYDSFVPILHGLMKCQHDRDNYDPIFGYFEYEWLNDDLVDKRLSLGYHSVDESLFARAFSELWPIEYEKSLALRIAASRAKAFIAHRQLISRYEESYCTGYGLILRIPVHEFLLEQVIDIGHDFVNAINDLRGNDLLATLDELQGLMAVVWAQSELSPFRDRLRTLLDVLRNIDELQTENVTSAKDALLYELEHNILKIPDSLTAAALRYLDIFESKVDRPSLQFSGVDALLAYASMTMPGVSSDNILACHPQTRVLGRHVAKEALASGLDKTLASRIFKVWPELANPHLTTSFEALIGFGHDHTIELATRLVNEVRPKHIVQMLGVGDKLEILESEMREKLISLYGRERHRELDNLFQKNKEKTNGKGSASETAWREKIKALCSNAEHKELDILFQEIDEGKRSGETASDRLIEFKNGMSARGIEQGSISLLHFVTIGELKTQLWAHTSKGKPNQDKPMFKPTHFKDAELNAHVVLVTAFRNAWAHHQPIESGFEEFDKSYHFVSEWVKSLEKLEQ